MSTGSHSSKRAALDLLTTALERDIASRDNVVLGLYSEALVALAVGGCLAPHRWESWDVEAADRGRVQVKTSTAMAIGKPTDAAPSVARWGGFKPGQRWLVDTNEFEAENLWHADIWVLARVEGLDPFDDHAWAFYVLTRSEVQSIGTQSASAATLLARGHQAVPLEELGAAYMESRSRQLKDDGGAS